MTPADRLTNIQTFLLDQRYLSGTSYTIESDEQDRIVITLKNCTARGLSTLKHRLGEINLSHIVVKAEKVREYMNQPQQQHRNKPSTRTK